MHAPGPQSRIHTSGLPVDRYPGVQPFGDTREDRLRFFGRDEETSVLLHQLLGVDMLVLFAKPGLGKTSLLRVRLFPRLRERDFLPVPVRFNHADSALTPMQVFTAAIEETCAAEAIDYTAGDPKSLWALFKTAIFWRGDRLQTPVLILDQFEEIFALQRDEFRHAAAAELGQLLGSRLPEHIRQQLQAGQPLPFSDRPPEVKVLFSLREDELGMLQELTPELPAILQHRFRLTGLSDADAQLAVTEPAGLVADDVTFATEPFAYDETTVAELLATARTNDGHIDPFVLQIFCGHIEKQVRQRQSTGMPGAAPLVVVTSDLHGGKGRKAPPATFYLETLDRLPGWTQRRRARRLCEDGLLTGDGRRRSLLQEDLKEDFNLDDASLDLLEQARLLRKEARPGGLYYEISHDRLAEAIRDERRWRLPRRVKIGAMVMAVIIVAACLYTYFAAYNQRRAQLARAEAERVLEYIIFDLQDRLTNLGGRALLDDIQREVDAYYERMGSLGESDAVLRRKLAALTNRADLLVNRGDLTSALAVYQSALSIQKQLAALDPSHTQWQRDLSVSHNRIGDVQQAQGDLAAALTAYQANLQIRERLAARDPSHTEWQTDLALSLYRTATVLEQQNPPRKGAAVAAYRRILDILRPLAAENRLTVAQKRWIAIVETQLDALKD